MKVTDIRKDSRHLMIVVEATADGWNGKQNEAARARIKAVNGEIVGRFENLPPGPSAIQVIAF